MEKDIKQLSFKELRHEVQKYAAALRAAGVKKGDRVAGGCLVLSVYLIASRYVLRLDDLETQCSPSLRLHAQQSGVHGRDVGDGGRRRSLEFYVLRLRTFGTLRL